MITVEKVTSYLAQSDCFATDRQGQEEPRLTLTPSVIIDSNYVIVVIETV
jgi:6-phosphogluconolactonase/glucosamine-6-phosphate isomerase/deaminase